ncbi:MAG TPA: glycosyltransferase family 1 protein, partial [Firmicutes bacterium]|nr:glycosyltransferase family 1 protein [Bacillota bacterium]
PRLAEVYDVTVLSDLPLEKEQLDRMKLIPKQNRFWGKRAQKNWSHLRYHCWMGKKDREHAPDYFLEVNHNLFFDPRPAKALVMIHDFYTLRRYEKFGPVIKRKRVFNTKRTLKRTDAVMTPSLQAKEEINEFFTYPGEKIFVNPPGIGHGTECPQRKPTGLPEGPFLFFVGRICYWKGIDLLIQSMDEEEFPKEVNVVLAGNLEARFSPFLEEGLNRHQRLFYLGRVSDEEREYLFRNSRGFLFPTRFEGFGLPPLEAALRECPLLVSDIPIMKEVTRGKAACFSLEEGAPALARAVRDLLTHPDPERVKEMKQAAGSYTWDAFAENIVEILESLSTSQ